jgi:hypothetical protein
VQILHQTRQRLSFGALQGGRADEIPSDKTLSTKFRLRAKILLGGLRRFAILLDRESVGERGLAIVIKFIAVNDGKIYLTKRLRSKI